jgi:hypothetical protein
LPDRDRHRGGPVGDIQLAVDLHEVQFPVASLIASAISSWLAPRDECVSTLISRALSVSDTGICTGRIRREATLGASHDCLEDLLAWGCP